MAKQKFHKGDLVRIADDLGESMSHFESGCDAVVIGSYDDQYGGGDTESYTLFIKNSGESSWYYGSQLTLIESGRIDKIDEWEMELEESNRQESNLDWMFSHGQDVIDNMYGSSIESLAGHIGIDNLWGSRGEGFVYMQNSLTVLSIAKPFLESQDKDGWIKHAAAMRAKMEATE